MTVEGFSADAAREYTRLFNALEGARYISVSRKFWRDNAEEFEYRKWHLCPAPFDPLKPQAHHFKYGGAPNEGPWCPYQPEVEKRFYKRMHRRIAARITRGTSFQHWLCSKEAFREATELLTRKHLQRRIFTTHEREAFSGYGPEYRVWFFQYMLACALLAYHNYFDYPEELKKRYPNAVPNYTAKEKQWAQNILISLQERGARPGPRTLYGLQLIASSDELTPFMVGGQEELSMVRRRRLFVEELAIVGWGKLTSKRGDTFRFPSDVIEICCRLIDYKLANVRAISGTVQKLEKSGRGPLVHPNKVKPFPIDGFYR